MKIICPGYPKTGTKSMRKALDVLGFESVHDVCEQLVYDYDIIKKFMNGTAKIDDYKVAFKDVDAFTEFPAALMWKEILEAFPDAPVLLSVRPDKAWLESIKHLVAVESKTSIWINYAKFATTIFPEFLCPNVQKLASYREFIFNQGFGFSPYSVGNPEQIDYDVTLKIYQKHNEQIKEYCKDRNFLVYDVSEGWEPLCKFLNKPVPNVPFPTRNFKHKLIADIPKTKGFDFDAGFNATVLYEINRALCIYAIILVGFGYLLLVLLL